MDYFGGHFGDPFWTRSAQDGPKRPTKSLKVQKTCNCKNLKKHGSLIFWGSKTCQDSLGKPEKAPKRHQKSSNTFKKGPQNVASKIYLFLQILEPFWGPFWSQQVLQNWTTNGTTFGTLSPRISGVGMLPKRKINRRCGTGKAAGLIPRKRKGGIRSLRAS